MRSSDQQLAIKSDELRKEQASLAQALDLSNEQAKEVAELSKRLDAAEQEYLRVSTLYRDAKKQGSELQKELKALLPKSPNAFRAG